ncbi:MAG: immunoglobulin domain-containing protein [Puniceicoccaceae bacterium]
MGEYESSAANDVASDARLIVGHSSASDGVREAVVWRKANNYQAESLNDILDTAGIDRQGSVLTNANAVTPDGSVIVGTMTNGNGDTEAFKVTLPPVVQIDMFLLQPTYEPCGLAFVNGAISSPTEDITHIHWDWGDGQSSFSWFPASHVYEDNGAYTVTATAHTVAGFTKTLTVDVLVTSIDPSCFEEELAATLDEQVELGVYPEEDAVTPADRLLVWHATPGKRYEAQQSETLEVWGAMEGFPSVAVEKLGSAGITSDPSAFYRVLEIDEQAPVITARFPDDGDFAIRRDSTMRITVDDPSGIDPESISLTVSGLGTYTTGSPELVYSDGLITLNMDSGNFLGGFGDSINATLNLADELGHQDSYAWSFDLESEPIIAENVFVFGSAAAQAKGQYIGDVATAVLSERLSQGSYRTLKSNPANWIIDSVYPDRIVLAYANATPPVFEIGTYLANLTPATAEEIFYRKIANVTDDGANGLLTLWTVEATLDEFIQQGSLSVDENSMVLINDAQGYFTEVLSIDGSYSLPDVGVFDLSGTEIRIKEDGYQATIGGVTFEWGEGPDVFSYGLDDFGLTISPTFKASVDFGFTGLNRFKGVLEADLQQSSVIKMTGLQQASFGPYKVAELNLGVISRLYLGNIGIVPVYVVMPLNLGLNVGGDVGGELSLKAGFRQGAKAVFGLEFDDDRDPEIELIDEFSLKPLQLVLPDSTDRFDVKFSATAWVELEPSISFLFYGLIGARTSIIPRSQLTYAYSLPTDALSVYRTDNVRLKISPYGPFIDEFTPNSISKELWQHERKIYPDEELEFTRQPGSVVVNKGDSVTFSASVNPFQNVTYQWYFDSLPIPGETGAQLTIASASVFDEGDYFLRATMGNEVLESAVATLSLNPDTVELKFVTQPQSAAVEIGESVTLTVEVNNPDGVVYRWFHNGLELTNLSGPQITLSNVTLDQAGQYFVFAQNVAGGVFSDTATITVMEAPLEITDLEYWIVYNVGNSWTEPDGAQSDFESDQTGTATSFNVSKEWVTANGNISVSSTPTELVVTMSGSAVGALPDLTESERSNGVVMADAQFYMKFQTPQLLEATIERTYNLSELSASTPSTNRVELGWYFPVEPQTERLQGSEVETRAANGEFRFIINQGLTIEAQANFGYNGPAELDSTYSMTFRIRHAQ